MMSRCFTTWSLSGCAFVALASLCIGCDEAPVTEPERAPASTNVDEPSIQEEAQPSAFSGDLTRFEEDVAAFVDLESCRRDLGRALPSSLGDLFADLRYERVVEDVCAGLAAASERDAARCDELATGALQRGCRRRVAALLEDPSLCAADDADTDVSCLAWATGRSELCSGAPSHEQVVCDAVARGDLRACARARVPSEATCRSLVTRHGPRDPRPAARAMDVHYEGHIGLPSGDVSLNANISRGLMLLREDCVPELMIEGQGSPRVRLTFGPVSGAATLTYFDGQTILGVQSDVTIQNPVVEMRLGGQISGLVETEVELDGQTLPLSVRFQTYVRNWLDPEECQPHDATRETTDEP